MSEKITFVVTLKQETVEKIEELLHYYKIRKALTNMDFPESYEDFIKASISTHIQRLEQFHSFMIDNQLYKLKSKEKLKNNVKLFLKDRNISNQELSERTGIDKSSLSNITSNRYQPSLDYFLRIWIVLGCPPIEELLYRDTT